MKKNQRNPHTIWDQHTLQWRNPLEVTNFSKDISSVENNLLQYRAKGSFWSILHKLKIRLLISREYEHLLIALGHGKKEPEYSYIQIPHPSGIAVDQKKKSVYVASTRNPNQVFVFHPTNGLIKRSDVQTNKSSLPSHCRYLLPVSSVFYPGSLYMHDLAIINGKLYANAVGHNAVVHLEEDGNYKYVWWPKCVDKKNRPASDANYLQLNSIAAGKSIRDSFFSASSDHKGSLRPGHIRFPVDHKGVIFSGRTRNPICRGLTRPHSARIYNSKIWVDNSGYGEFGFIQGDRFQEIIKLPGWTRGLCIKSGVAFVGVSRVIPKFYRYAPGLDVKKSVCGIYAIELKSGKVLGSLTWPLGNQIFSVECMDKDSTAGFPCEYLPKRKKNHLTELFYRFDI